MSSRDPWEAAKPVSSLRRDPDATAATATIFAALSHPLRLRVLAWLHIGPLDAHALSRGLEVDKQLLSHHLATLRAAGLVRYEDQSWELDPSALPRIQTLLSPDQSHPPSSAGVE